MVTSCPSGTSPKEGIISSRAALQFQSIATAGGRSGLRNLLIVRLTVPIHTTETFTLETSHILLAFKAA